MSEEELSCVSRTNYLYPTHLEKHRTNMLRSHSSGFECPSPECVIWWLNTLRLENALVTNSRLESFLGKHNIKLLHLDRVDYDWCQIFKIRVAYNQDRTIRVLSSVQLGKHYKEVWLRACKR